MRKFSCIVIEDEPLAMERTTNFINKVSFFNHVESFENAIKALNYLNTQPVDVVFLDINMDELTGIELLESTQLESEIVITTAYQQYALKGYELDVTDYLLKPFTFQRFLQAANKVRHNLELRASNQLVDFTFIKTENRLVKVRHDEIIYIEGMRDYRRIHLIDGVSIMTLQRFSDLEHLFPHQKICRVHKSYMVSLDKIEHVERNRIRIGKVIIPISATYKTVFFDRIQN